MNDPQPVVDEIRAFLQANDQSLKPRLKELAAEYAELCAEVNRRLAACAQLIKQGLRGEAIHQADADPNLLAALAELDFSERTAWLDLVSIYDLPAPSDLDQANAEHLNTAYAEHDPLKNLMRKHRRLALARAPLRDRLAVLREFARIDPTNPIWAEDVKTYELERFKQMQVEAADAVRRDDAPAAEALENELDGIAWSTAPPGSLVRAVHRAAATAREKAARRALPEIEERLRAAHAAANCDDARRARARWITLAETAQLAPDDPLRSQVEPVLLWIDEQDREAAAQLEFEDATAELEDALNDRTASRGEVEELWTALGKLGGNVPRPIAQKYQERLDDFALKAKRKMRLIAASAVASFVLLAVSATALYLLSAAEKERLEAAATIQAALDGNRVEELDGLLKRMKSKQPAVLASAQVQALMPRVKSARDKEEARAGNFARLMTEAEGAALTSSEPEPLKEARGLARTDREKSEVEELARQLVRRNSEEAARRDQLLAPVLDEVGRTADEIAKKLRSAGDGDSKLSEQVAAAVRQLDRAGPNSGPLGQATLDRVEQLRGRLTELGQDAERAARRGRAADALTDAVRRLPEGLDAYVGAAQKLKTEYGPAVQGADIDKILTDPERQTWESALRWSVWAREWAADGTLDPATARTRVETCKKFLLEYPRCPDSAAVRRYVAYLEPIASRDAPANGLRLKITRALSGPSMNNLYMVRYKKNKDDARGSLRYYSQVQPGSGPSLQLRCLVDAEGNIKPVTLGGLLIVGPRGLSPQSKQVLRLREALESEPALSNWDKTMLDIAGGVAGDAEMDPVCKLMFLNTLLKLAAEGSVGLGEALGPTLKMLARVSEFRTVRWLDPDANVDDKRAEAEAIVKGLPRWDEVARKAKETNDRQVQSLAQTARPVGWISRKSTGFSVRFAASEADVEKLPLFVATPGKNDGIWKPLGRVVNDAGDLDLQQSALGAEGRLVFTRSSASSDAGRHD